MAHLVPGRRRRSQTNTASGDDASDLELDLLCVLAFTGCGVSRTAWTDALKKAGVTGLNGKPLSTTEMAQHCKRLASRVVCGGSASTPLYSLTPQAATDALLEAQTRGRLSSLWRRWHGDGRGYYYWDTGRIEAEARVHLVCGDGAAFGNALARMGSYGGGRAPMGRALLRLLGTAPPPEWLALLNEPKLADVRDLYLAHAVKEATMRLQALSAPVLQAGLDAPAVIRMDVARYLAVRGELQEPARALGLPANRQRALDVLQLFWSGDYAGAHAAATAAGAKAKQGELRSLEGLCRDLARVAMSSSDGAAWEALGNTLAGNSRVGEDYVQAYASLTEFHRAMNAGEQSQLWHRWAEDTTWLSRWVQALVERWSAQPIDTATRSAHQAELEGWARAAEAAGFLPVSRELAALSSPEAPVGSLVSSYHCREPWEMSLEALRAIAAASSVHEPEGSGHIVWVLSPPGADGLPRIEARLIEGGRATKGKRASLERLLNDSDLPVSAADRRVLMHAQREEAYGYYRSGRMTLRAEALLDLVGHPHVVDAAFRPLTVQRGEPGLALSEVKGTLQLALDPPGLAVQPVACVSGEGCVTVYARTSLLERFVGVLGRGPLAIPKRGQGLLKEVVAAVSSQLPVSAGPEARGEEERAGDPTPVFALHWLNDTLTVQLRVAPLGMEGPLLTPGRGRPDLTAVLEQRLVAARRDLAEEARRAGEVMAACPRLADQGGGDGVPWTAPDLESALEIMQELAQLGERVRLAWPAGAKLGIPQRRDLRDLRVVVADAAQWLHVAVHLPVDEGLVLSFAELLERRRGRFVKLDHDRFIALSESLAKRLDHLASLGHVDGEGVRASAALLPALDALLDGGPEVTIEPTLQERLRTIQRVTTATPRTPRGFGATLRDYQREGFTWLARLGTLGLGAALADDMGLGKTIQTLAVLCHRGSAGPALVVAPASVIHNWRAEMQRFAPTLTPVMLAAAADRATACSQLRARDVLLCSYGVLVGEAERLAALRFSTVVFDEAHALKNAGTKRAKAAFALRADFRVALTGTPLENHLGELWGLMQAVLPGLLGSQRRFERQFIQPIAEGDRERASHLRAIIRPFVLRRSKAQVLDELPPREEITIRVTPTVEQASFYEAQRLRALAQLEGGGRLQVLAEITRLRQTAVDPRLVDPGAPAGAKLDVLMEQLIALREEGHRALVFSQFLGSLALIKDGLSAAGLTYLALDGSTPSAERQYVIERFQNGEADVFVMSLKAGGVGVNLTAADYVIHVEPWWNPAVEDQATGRAHRIGQARPVTVYRLITEGTIEEQILNLHGRKRELATDLLADLETAKALDIEELKGLLQR